MSCSPLTVRWVASLQVWVPQYPLSPASPTSLKNVTDGNDSGKYVMPMPAQQGLSVKELHASVTSRGQVTIPVEVRRLLGVARGEPWSLHWLLSLSRGAPALPSRSVSERAGQSLLRARPGRDQGRGSHTRRDYGSR